MKVYCWDKPLIVQGSEVWMRMDYNPPRNSRDKKRGPATACLLLGKKTTPEAEPPVLAVGMAYQNPKDRYDPLKGRSHAFGAALLELSQLYPEAVTAAVREGCHAWFRDTMRQADDDRVLICPHCQGVSAVSLSQLPRVRHPLPPGGLKRAVLVVKRSGSLKPPAPADPPPAAPKGAPVATAP